MTALKQAQQQFLEAERTRSRLAQTLTSEISHRTKNNLAIVAGCSNCSWTATPARLNR